MDAASDTAPGGIVELRWFKDATGRERAALAVRYYLPIEAQVQLVGQEVAKAPESAHQRSGAIVATPILSGLHHRYARI